MMAHTVLSHIWQSTLFAAVAGLLTLTLRQNSARVRYRLWLAASVKFLIPFAALVELGRRLAWPGSFRAPGIRLQFVVDVIAGAGPHSRFAGLESLYPIAFVVWIAGTLTVMFVWGARWRSLSAAARHATPLSEGRELEALRRVLGTERLELKLSLSALEPGVFGVWRPVLLWPAGISDRLSDAQLDAILVHELRHVERRDNLTSALHMLVEAVFWFHPLVWWLGARLLEERERVCDEDVLRRGSEAHVYAEGILKVCQFCLASPLECMAGVSGSDLKKRMVYIMTKRTLQKLNWGRKLLLAVAGMSAMAVPVAFGLVSAGASRVAVATAAQEAGAPVRVSQQDMSGQIVKKVQPEYPEAAKKAVIQGKVLLNATISKEGNVENLQVVSGPPQLAPSAIEAVKQWKYQPYMKNGAAVEVETEITVNYTLAK